MKRIFFIVIILIGVIIASCSNLKKKYEYLLEPQILYAKKQKMVSIEVTGAPEAATHKVGELYKVFFKLQFKNKKMVAPRARWPMPFDTPRDQWVSIWALPVPDDLTEIPMVKTSTPVEFTEWYGSDIAEILHVGSYSTEQPTVERLHRFIADNGYQIRYETHEEEYLVGPGMFGKGNPDKYLTIIRYEITKKF